MAKSRRVLRGEHGAMRTSMLLVNLAEYQFRKGRDGVRWDGEAWFGGDIDRLEISSEGDATPGHRIEDAEVQALWSRAVDPYFNLRTGVRQDFGAGPSRTYLTAGVEGIAPYWLDIEAAAFVSDKGRVSARLKVDYDLRITQRLIVQPRAEANLALVDDVRGGVGSGLSNIELGLRARYELRREFAPYIGVSWLRQTGDSARFARAGGQGASERSVVAGVRFWF